MSTAAPQAHCRDLVHNDVTVRVVDGRVVMDMTPEKSLFVARLFAQLTADPEQATPWQYVIDKATQDEWLQVVVDLVTAAAVCNGAPTAPPAGRMT